MNININTNMKPLAAFITFIYTILLLYWMFIGFGRTHYTGSEYRYNLIPFQTLKMYFLHADSFNLRTWVVNVVGNVVVFVPFGIALPYLFRWKLFRFTLSFIVALFLLELLQLVLRRGSFDIDDVLLNTIGGVIGFTVFQIGKRIN